MLDQPNEQRPCKHVHIFQRLITKHHPSTTHFCKRLPRATVNNSTVLTGSLNIEHLMLKCAKGHVPLHVSMYEIWKVVHSIEIFNFKDVHASDWDRLFVARDDDCLRFETSLCITLKFST
jgi:hypothetical protein